MLKIKRQKIFDIEKNSKFADRVIFLSLPSGFVFLMLVAFKLISPILAIISYITIIIFNIALLFPITFEMQLLKKYISNLAQGRDFDTSEMNLSEKEAQEIADAINTMHRFWSEKNEELEAQTISDTAVLDSLPDPIMMIDRYGRIIGANSSAHNLIEKNIIDKNIDTIFDSNNFINAVSKVLSKESEAENLIFYVRKPQHKKLYAHIKQLPWITKGRAVAVISVYDLTKALKIEKMQSDFVANASHELRTPLSVISGCIETLQTTAKNDDRARETFLKLMSEQTEYMSSLIENLLSLSKIELSLDQSPEEKVYVPKIINDVTEGLSLKAKEREMNLVVEIDGRIPNINGDEHQIKQLVQNLTDNAIKYGLSPSDVTIRITAVDGIPPSKTFNVAKGEAIAISINNMGPKIEPENVARITERFYRLQEHKNMSIKGTGLGLSIAKQIILRHRGNLTVTSTSYTGTTFTVYLPLKQ
ncbi:MAG: PAS domain-containing sensor histidine kinase [Lactobacillaceae bacterium]|jgi:two-component system phosphate regulon sensor histidine kinase PhoR|nr:PAS domain-containing sensor histidine kinase [Lactobacillaceae bacterium]